VKFYEIWMEISSDFGGDGEERTIRNIKVGVGLNEQDEIHKNLS